MTNDTSSKTLKPKRVGLYSQKEKRDFPFLYTIIAVPVLHFLIFYVYVNLSSFRLAFTSADGGFTLNYIKQVFSELGGGGKLLPMFGRSILLYAVNLMLAPVAWATTYVLFRRIRFHYFFRVCYMIPGLLGAVVWTSLIKYMLAFDGPIVALITNMGFSLPEAAIRNGLLGASQTSFLSLVTINIIMGVVGNNVVLTGAMSRMPDEIFESLELDGCSFWRSYFSVVLPLVWPTISTLLTLGLCGILTGDASVFLYSNGTGEPGMATIGFYLYKLTLDVSTSGGANPAVYGYPAAFGLVLTAFTVPIVLIGRKILEAVTEPVEY